MGQMDWALIYIYVVDKLHTHLMDLESLISLSTLKNLQENKMPVKLELISM